MNPTAPLLKSLPHESRLLASPVFLGTKAQYSLPSQGEESIDRLTSRAPLPPPEAAAAVLGFAVADGVE